MSRLHKSMIRRRAATTDSLIDALDYLAEDLKRQARSLETWRDDGYITGDDNILSSGVVQGRGISIDSDLHFLARVQGQVEEFEALVSQDAGSIYAFQAEKDVPEAIQQAILDSGLARGIAMPRLWKIAETAGKAAKDTLVANGAIDVKKTT